MSSDTAAVVVVVADPTARAVAGELLDGTGAAVVAAEAVPEPAPQAQAMAFWIGRSPEVEAPALFHLGRTVSSAVSSTGATFPLLVVGVDPDSPLRGWLIDELDSRRPGLAPHDTVADLAAAVRAVVSRQEQGMRSPLITGLVREELARTLVHLGGLKDITAAFAKVGLPEPVAEDGRINKSPKLKLISRLFDAIDWTDGDQTRAVLRLGTQAMLVKRNESRHYGDNFTTDVTYLNLKNALASDGYGIDEQLRIVALTGPAPVDEPLARYADPEKAVDVAIHEALAAAQTVRTMLDRAGSPLMNAPQGQALTWQVRDATEALLAQQTCLDLEPATREAFEHLGGAAAALFTFTHKRHGDPYHVDQTTAWTTQITLRAWTQVALELLEVARAHRSGSRPADRSGREPATTVT